MQLCGNILQNVTATTLTYAPEALHRHRLSREIRFCTGTWTRNNVEISVATIGLPKIAGSRVLDRIWNKDGFEGDSLYILACAPAGVIIWSWEACGIKLDRYTWTRCVIKVQDETLINRLLSGGSTSKRRESEGKGGNSEEVGFHSNGFY